VWEDKEERILNVSLLREKPSSFETEIDLAVRNQKGEKEYCSVLGQYILTPEVFHQLEADIKKADEGGDRTREIELTSALEEVRQQTGMIGVRLVGERYDMGNPSALIDTMTRFPLSVER
jgi:UTP-glucose-1-phosphate uridylyltransferase